MSKNHLAPSEHPSKGGKFNSPPLEGWQAKPDGVVKLANEAK